jgi:hypothetical protein
MKTPVRSREENMSSEFEKRLAASIAASKVGKRRCEGIIRPGHPGLKWRTNYIMTCGVCRGPVIQSCLVTWLSCCEHVICGSCGIKDPTDTTVATVALGQRPWVFECKVCEKPVTLLLETPEDPDDVTAASLKTLNPSSTAGQLYGVLARIYWRNSRGCTMEHFVELYEEVQTTLSAKGFGVQPIHDGYLVVWNGFGES